MKVRSLHGWALAVLAGAALLLPRPAAAQQTGAVAGTVVRASNQQPLDAAQVLVVGTGLGTLTDAEGNFRITEVPAGTQSVRVQLVGYGTTSQQVDVTAGQVARVEFALEQSAIQLSEIVVTGTGTEGVQRKKLGNTIASINTEQLQNAPASGLTELVQGKEAGVSVLPSSGLAGEGQAIRIRGSASLSQSNEPLVYIDGVRVSGGGGFAGDVDAGATGAGASSRLDDLDPNAIARVEVLKGAAAATLYGTEASNGVIQIFTKSGREGDTRWTFEVENGVELMPTNRLIPHADFPRDATQAQRMTERWGQSVEPYQVIERNILDDVDETGRSTTLSGYVNGGGEGITYFASGRYQNLDGIMGFESLGPARDHSERYQATANLNVFPVDKLRLKLRTNYSRTNQTAPSTANNIYGVWPMMFHSQLRFANCSDHSQACNYYGTPVFVTPEEAMQQEVSQDVDHFGGSLQTSYQPGEGVSLTGTFGVDYVSNNSEEHTPFGWNVDNFGTSNVQGIRDVGSQDHMEVTAELRSGWDTQLGEDFSSTFTAGGQGFLTETLLRGGNGQNFAGPGLEVVSAAANQTVDESWITNVNLGLFAQEQVGYRNFAFLTVGGRYDVNSAFGETSGGEFYPKLSASVIPSDLSGWDNSTLSTLRFRGAWGQSGLQPGAFDQFRTYAGLASATGPGYEPGNLGNPDIRPEVSTEIEGGLELGLFNDRAAVEFTYWDRTVDDVLVNKQFPVSGGFEALQLTNIGEMEAYGFDISANGTAIRGEDFRVNLFANAAYIKEEVTDMGGAPPIKTGGSYPRNRNFIIEGYAPGAFLGARLADAEIPLDLSNTCTASSRQEALTYFSQPRNLSDFEVLPVDCGQATVLQQFLGKPTPDWSGALGTDISFGNFQFRAMGEYKFGLQRQDLSGAFRQSNALIGRNTPETARIASTMLNPASSAEERLDAAVEWARQYRGLSPMSGLNQIWDADYIKLREVALTYDAPSDFAGNFGMRSLALSLRARNLAFWVTDEYRGLDPELNNNARCGTGDVDCNFLLGQEAWRLPIPRRLLLAVRAGF
ncbi:MAG: SusC/RagA family TonB-linked outer membrane protein [Candidatus Palauibacterales bacterium]|nr:SusC/RagA family TonB-linked outer membrane protein [Candidatus Palauibacterales bacterium]